MTSSLKLVCLHLNAAPTLMLALVVKTFAAVYVVSLPYRRSVGCTPLSSLRYEFLGVIYHHFRLFNTRTSAISAQLSRRLPVVHREMFAEAGVAILSYRNGWWWANKEEHLSKAICRCIRLTNITTKNTRMLRWSKKVLGRDMNNANRIPLCKCYTEMNESMFFA